MPSLLAIFQSSLTIPWPWKKNFFFPDRGYPVFKSWTKFALFLPYFIKISWSVHLKPSYKLSKGMLFWKLLKVWKCLCYIKEFKVANFFQLNALNCLHTASPKILKQRAPIALLICNYVRLIVFLAVHGQVSVFRYTCFFLILTCISHRIFFFPNNAKSHYKNPRWWGCG